MKINQDTLSFFENKLADFFVKAGRETLPWRQESLGAYEIWVSEIMLQQTQVSRVIDYYRKFLERFPTVESLARASWEEFLPYYQGLGYYARGRNMLLAAQKIVQEHGGLFPTSVASLDALPGIGPYTAAAIASFAYDQNTVAWDTNLRRVTGRFFFGTKKSPRVFELENAFSVRAKILNAALMDLGSSLCGSTPKCAACPLALKCRYRREQGKQERLKNQRAKERRGTDWKVAPLYIVLHALHREYFSENRESYQPFALPRGFTDRAGIKQWFVEHYGLVVSVRPPKQDSARGIIWVNVQILSGEFAFQIYSRESFRAFLSRLETPV